MRIKPGSRLGQLAVLIGSYQEIERSLLKVFDGTFLPYHCFTGSKLVTDDLLPENFTVKVFWVASCNF